MTILVTYKVNDTIYLGSDTQITNGGQTGYCSGKWIKLKLNETDSCHIGVTGFLKFIDFFKYGFTVPAFHNDENFEEYLHTKLAPKITEILTQRQIAPVKDSRLDTESIILIVYENNVYVLEYDAAPVKIEDDFYATGSGMYYAYGAYHVLWDKDDVDGRQKVVTCLGAACRYDVYCGGAYQIMEIKND